MSKINKINRVVIDGILLSDIDNKATKTELQNTKNELENQINEVVFNLVRKESVPSYDDILLTYPNPKEGWTVSVNDTNITYQYDDDTSTWIKTSINALPKATSSLDGLLTKEDKVKLDTVQQGAEVNKSTEVIFTEIKAIDGSNSGLDADLLDGKHASEFATSTHNHDGRYYTQSQMNSMVGGKSNIGHTHDIKEINNLVIPKKLSELENDSGLATERYVNTQISDAVLNGSIDLTGYVPTSRMINGKNLTNNITLSASDIRAEPSGTATSAVSSHNTSRSAHSSLFAAKQDKLTAGGNITIVGTTISASVPTKTSQLTNDSNFLEGVIGSTSPKSPKANLIWIDTN